ncbi:MAG: SlyX family protein [Comamonadaceae bacterium]|jgi:SlyX protein|uniref:SlyX family protein n=1 Tax=Hydrogenophaga sp. SNF1 TaxID=3098762 RepID=UPI002ACC1C77|nr:SlyX family protein [Hydrogenophaga sp. SNF1]NCT98923.1 SlyX family protein [Comamonadaceae bacterium]WQB83558.1 SlyX family protein [Hydrogenophaga sp. SNF1]
MEPTDADARLTHLEIKASFAEDLLDTLNEIVARQQAQINRLTAELSTLRNQMPTADGAAVFRSLRDELPPHY